VNDVTKLQLLLAMGGCVAFRISEPEPPGEGALLNLDGEPLLNLDGTPLLNLDQ
jgi:hypothetical protein